MRRRFLVALAIVASLAASVPAGAQTLDEKLGSVAKRIEDVSSQIESSAAERSQLAGAILGTRARMDELLANLASTRSELTGVERDLNLGRLHLDQVRADLARQYEKLAATRELVGQSKLETLAWARRTYMNAGHGMGELAFSVTELNQVALSVEYMNRVTAETESTIVRFQALEEQERRQQETIEAKERQVATEVTALETLEGQLAALRDRLVASSEAVAAELGTQQVLLGEVDREIALFEGELADLEKEQADIERLIAERQQQGGTRPGVLVRPVPGAITSGFGPRWHPILGIQRMHSGVDMSGGSGTPIQAGAAGKVILAGYNGGYGNTVVIDHGGGMTTLYAHQSRIDVSYGETVSAGQVVGYVGSTGLSTGPHLHFEVRLGGKAVDPAQYL